MEQIFCSRKWILLLAGSLLMLSMNAASALTFKKGQVLGPDGVIYDGASPQVRANIIRKAQESGDKAGVFGRAIFVVTGEDLTFVPISSVAGKDEAAVKDIIGNAVVAKLTGIEGLTLSTFTSAKDLAATKNIPIGNALIEQAFLDASEAALNADVDPVSAADAQALLAKLLGPELSNKDGTPVTKEQMLEMIEGGKLDELADLAGLSNLGDDTVSASELSLALSGLDDVAREATEEAWGDISAEDLDEALDYMNDYLAQDRQNAIDALTDPAYAASPEGQALAAEYGL